LEPKARKAFGAMRTENKTLKSQLAELRPLAEEATRLTSAFDRYKARENLSAITEEEHVGVVSIQASINRAYAARDAGKELSAADRSILERVVPQFEQIATDLGLTTVPKASPIPAPYKGFLTEDHKALIESGVTSEASLRQLIAIEESAKETAAQKAAETQNPPRRQAAASPPATSTRRSPAVAPASTQARPTVDPLVKRFADLTDAYLTERSVASASQRTHVEGKLKPIIFDLIAAAVPNGDPATLWDKAKPEARHQLIKVAQGKFEAAAKAAATRTRTSSAPIRDQRPLQQRDTRSPGQRPRTDNRTQAQDPVDDVQARLAGEARS
jgi:hypothetical protein